MVKKLVGIGYPYDKLHELNPLRPDHPKMKEHLKDPWTFMVHVDGQDIPVYHHVPRAKVY